MGLGRVAYDHATLAQRPGIARHTAKRYGVTVEHLLFIVKQRKLARASRRDRARHRKHGLKNRLFVGHVRYANEGELETLMRVESITQAEFCEVAGVHRTTLQQWQGWPLYQWPLRLLRLFIWARNMARFLRSKGYDPDTFQPKLPDRVPPQSERKMKIVLEGLSEEERARKRSEYGRRIAQIRWGKKDPDYTPWKT